MLLSQYWFSDRIALYAMHGRVVTREEQPQLHGIVDRLCATADMPRPQIAVSDTDLPNAFATGRNADHAVLCVTTGLLRRLEPDELEGVLAHELSHVAHRDVAVITVASFLGVIAGLIVRFAFYSQLYGGPRPARPEHRWPCCSAVMAVSALVYSLSFLLDPGAVALPGTGRRPGRGAAHRAPLRPRLGADQARRGHRPHPQQGPAHGERVQRLLLRPGPRRGQQHRPALRHPPEPGAAPRPAGHDLRRAGTSGLTAPAVTP